MGFFDELKQGVGVVGRGVAAYYTAGGSEIALKNQRDARRAAQAMGVPLPPPGTIPGARRPPARRSTGPPLATLIVVGSLGVVALMVVAKGIK